MEGGSETSELPIALRRTRRNPSPKQTPCASPKRPARGNLAMNTPKSRKGRVRFSDPGPDLAGKKYQSSTGLTPMIQRTSLSGSRTPRRRSTPARLFPSNGNGIPGLDSQGSPFGGEVHFLPLRQVLDGRVKRRIRRNGLSEEMNTISTEKRRRAEETKAEIERLRTELAEKDGEIERLHDETVVLDTERVWDLEQQVASLKRQLASRSGVQEVPSSPPVGWTSAARDPYSDNFMELDVEDSGAEFGESTRAELACSTPTRRMCAAFPTPPATSPEPKTPETPCRHLPTPRSSTAIQTSLPDPEKQHLEEELGLLRLEVAKLTTTLESYSALTSRLSDKLTPILPQTSSDEPSTEDPDIETHLTTVLQTLSDRTAALTALDSSLKTLGFPGADGFEVLESLRASLRTARLELEYLTPGETPLPLTGAGLEVLTLTLTHLRDLTHKFRDATDTIDEYHALIISLRSQLRARVAATDSLSSQLTTTEHTVHTKDAHIAALDAHLADAAQAHTRDVADLESLTARLETDLAAARAAAESENAAHAVVVAELEGQLAAAQARMEGLQAEMDALVVKHGEERGVLERAHGAALAERDARVVELEGEVERRLRAENRRLGEVGVRERGRAEEVVRGMRGELEKVLRMGEGFLSGNRGGGEDESEVVAPLGESKVGRSLSDSDDVASLSGRTGKRRKYDSGLGFLDEEADAADV
ncbi:uncharacterized protein B0H64DRAFT_418813 [Chaetomium fimeti]|uniref:Uncharacterized protein n=1 Tax=Chaetomium fimeti TaxID=1854472 RepID=A0AAE0HAD0_9PEZI|nr:hypothetical protein B0H64DRAFT_418813 [Chaetomium fimeti]